MKTEKWYDVRCDFCGRYISTDFGCGMLRDRETAIKEARRVGYKTIQNKNICPMCQEIHDTQRKEKKK